MWKSFALGLTMMVSLTQAQTTRPAEIVIGPGDAWPALRGGETVVLEPGLYTLGRPLEIAAPDVTVRAEHRWTAIIRNADYHGVYVYRAATGCTVEGLEVRGCAGSGIKTDADDTTIRECWVHHNALNGVEGHGVRGLVLEGCRVQANGTDGYAHGVYADGSGHVYRSNEVIDNASHGLHLYPSMAGSAVINNVCRGNPQRQILIRAPTDDIRAPGNTVAGNTVDDGWIGIGVFGGWTRSPQVLAGNRFGRHSIAPVLRQYGDPNVLEVDDDRD